MSSRKRSRADFYAKTAPRGAMVVYKPPPASRKRRRFTPGVDRVGGFYGRYSGRGGEMKFHDVDLDDANIAASAITATINIIGQGVTESTRVGRKCTIRRIQWRYQISLPEVDALGTPASGDTVRIILYKDKQANGATANATDILEAAVWQSFRNLANSGRFDILMDKLHNINYMGLASDGAGVVSQAAVIHNYTFFKNCSIPIEFDNTTGAITEIRSNNIGVLLLSATQVAAFESGFRLRFSDV